MAEDQRSKGGVFYTGQLGAVPPLVTTQFATVDQGNSGPHFIRSSMYNVPATIDMMKQVYFEDRSLNYDNNFEFLQAQKGCVLL